MPVQKVSIENLQKANLEYMRIPNYILQGIKNITALSVYLYMRSLPLGTDIQKEHIRKELGLSKYMIDKVFVFLHENYLIEYERTRDSNGKMTGIKTKVLDGSIYYENKVKNIA